mgnify:CR=1 FL=1
MTQNERCAWLIKYLLTENPEAAKYPVPEDFESRFKLYRSLVNIRMPADISEEYLKIEDEFLYFVNANSTNIEDLSPVRDDIYVWQGDITKLRVDAIVNAANSQMLGCFVPCHSCIDNCIHTFAGIRLRQACAKLMREQGHEEATGRAKITKAYNLPGKYVIHTVGPICSGSVSEEDKSLLYSCYEECLKLADAYKLESIAFCCISTGVFGFPNKPAAEIAIKAVQEYKQKTGSKIKVIFNVFKDLDKEIYGSLLAEN